MGLTIRKKDKNWSNQAGNFFQDRCSIFLNRALPTNLMRISIAAIAFWYVPQ